MDYDGPDSSGTDDDDITPPLQNRVPRGNHGRSSLVSAPYSRVHMDMVDETHYIEEEAYCSVLRAFKAQSDAISWDKESLITELRKELKVTDDEHRELLSRVNSDDVIRRIRDWRLTVGTQAATHNGFHEILPNPSMSGLSASRKKQKTSQLQGQSAAANAMPYPLAAPSGSRQSAHRNSSGGLPEADPWIGKKVWTRWPEDNKFYEAVIADYNPVEGVHALVYDQNTANETREWVNLKEIPAADILWQAGEPGVVYQGSNGARNRGGPTKGQFRKDQNGVAKKLPEYIELLDTGALIQEVEKLLGSSNPNPIELAKYRRLLKEQEDALVAAISMLPDFSDSKSDEDENPDMHAAARKN